MTATEEPAIRQRRLPVPRKSTSYNIDLELADALKHKAIALKKMDPATGRMRSYTDSEAIEEAIKRLLEPPRVVGYPLLTEATQYIVDGVVDMILNPRHKQDTAMIAMLKNVIDLRKTA